MCIEESQKLNLKAQFLGKVPIWFNWNTLTTLFPSVSNFYLRKIPSKDINTVALWLTKREKEGNYLQLSRWCSCVVVPSLNFVLHSSSRLLAQNWGCLLLPTFLQLPQRRAAFSGLLGFWDLRHKTSAATSPPATSRRILGDALWCKVEPRNLTTSASDKESKSFTVSS